MLNFAKSRQTATWILAPLAVLFAGVAALAAGGGGHGGHGDVHLTEADIKTIIYQAINVSVIVIGLVYYLRKPVQDFFANKHQNFVQAAEKAMTAQKKAEEEYRQIEEQMRKLETTTQESVLRAQAEAADLRNSLVAEANALSKRIHDEGHLAATLEVAKAEQAIRQQMIEEATKLAQAQIGSLVSSDDHARLNKEFIQNIEAVQQ